MSDEKVERLQVALQRDAAQKIDRWRNQVAAKCNVEISRRALLNWYVSKSPENLSSSDLAQITQKFFDEEKLLKSLLQKVRRARESGTETGVELVVRQKRNEARKDEAEEAATPEDSALEASLQDSGGT